MVACLMPCAVAGLQHTIKLSQDPRGWQVQSEDSKTPRSWPGLHGMAEGRREPVSPARAARPPAPTLRRRHPQADAGLPSPLFLDSR